MDVAPSPREKVLLALVGLPARGKSYIAHKIVSFMRWMNKPAEIFNVGKFRRDRISGTHQADFFSASNEDAKAARESLAMGVLGMALDWLRDGGAVGVFDATNTTRERRRAIVEYVKSRTDVTVSLVFLESICDDEEVMTSNLLQKARCSPDYRSMPLDAALADLRERIANYERVYEPVEDLENVSYVKLINLRSKLICHRLHGSTMHRIVALLMSVHIGRRPVWLTRAGEVVHTTVLDDKSRDALIRRHLLARTLSVSVEVPPRPPSEPADGESADPLAKPAIVLPDDTMSALAGQSSHADAHTGISDATSPTATSDPSTPAITTDAYHTDVRHTTAALVASGVLLAAPPIARMPHSATTALALSEGGRQYASALTLFVQRRCNDLGLSSSSVVVHSSTVTRAMQTARMVAPPYTWSTLNALDTGILHGMTVEQIRQRMPEEHAAWMQRPFNTRIPGGESYADGMRRLQPFVIEVEREMEPVLVVSHLSTLQLLYGYFKSVPVDKIPFLAFPPHTVIELRPSQYGWEEHQFTLAGASDTTLESTSEAPPSA